MTIAAPTIAPTPPPRIEEVLRLLLSRLEPADRDAQVSLLLAASRAAGDFDGLFEARRQGRTVGAVLAQLQPGRAATVWMPRLVPGEPAATALRLLDSANAFLARSGISMAHVLLERPDPHDEALLAEAGFLRLAELRYLAALEVDFPAAAPGSELEYLEVGDQVPLASVLEATYEATLDCPELNGARPIEDVLAGYAATGASGRRWWRLVRHGGNMVGCLLVADHPHQEACELVYMGLVPGARGRGWGRRLARYAQWLTRRAGRRQLVLAVDAANHPAVALYAAEGFSAWERRWAYWRTY